MYLLEHIFFPEKMTAHIIKIVSGAVGYILKGVYDSISVSLK